MATGQRTKGMRQKISNQNYGNFIPFGSDGKYIDMDSSLDLEEELKLGGKHSAEIIENENAIIIKETYENNGYSVLTNIIENNGNIEIVSQLYKDDVFLHGKRTFILENNEKTTIEESLYEEENILYDLEQEDDNP